MPLPLGREALLSFQAIVFDALSMHSGSPDTSTTTPLAVVELSVRALMARIFTWSMPRSSATIPIIESTAYCASTISCPRTVPQGALFE